MNMRRINDFLKIAGAVVGALALFGPVFSRPHESIGALIGDLLSASPAALGFLAAGLGTRGLGHEDQEVADAKAIAKTIPPAA